MNDNDIVKALEICNNGYCYRDGCPLACGLEDDSIDKCKSELSKAALDLISRQKTEIERLKKGWRADVVETAKAKSEAIREFAELLKKNAQKFTEYDEGGWGCTVYAVKVEDIDNTVEGMTEEAV